MNMQNYIRTCMSSGKYFFTGEEALRKLGITYNQFRYQVYRLQKKRSLYSLGHNFFMIIPAEYHDLGSLPPLWIVNPYMKHLAREYYVGLLSAAALYGATEQQPMNLQVLTDKRTADIILERSAIQFHENKRCLLASTTEMVVATGYVRVSTKEQTIVDLVKFYKSSGYLSNVAIVIRELAPECDGGLLSIVLKNEIHAPVLQRLGYIVDTVGFPILAEVIENELDKRILRYVRLYPDFVHKKGDKNRRWKLILNDKLEIAQ